MKFRISERFDGRFDVEIKRSLFSGWNHISSYPNYEIALVDVKEMILREKSNLDRKNGIKIKRVVDIIKV